MKSQVKPGENSQLTLEVEISLAEMEPELKAAGRRIARQINIPGFRKGKAPYAVLESFVGAESILQEAAENLVADAYEKALKENDIESMAHPQINIVQIEKNKPLIFEALVTTRPEVKLGQYKEIPLKRLLYQVEDEDVDEEMEKIRERLSRIVDAPAEAKIEKGDTANIDFKGFVDGTAFQGGEAENYALVVGSGSFIPGFEDQLLGMSVGERKDIEVTFPEDYPQEKLAGKPAVFKVTLNSIKRKQLPEINEELVKEVSEEAETVEQLREEVKKKLLQDYEIKAEDNCLSEGIQAAVNNAQVDIPSIMIEERLELMLQELSNKFASQGVDLDKYLEYAKMTREQLKVEYRPQAENEIKLQLVLEAIAKAENLEVTEEDIEKQLTLIAQKSWQPVESVKATLEAQDGMKDLKANILCNKAGKVIYENANISQEIVTKAQLEAMAAETIAAEAAKAQEDTDQIDAQKEQAKEDKPQTADKTTDKAEAAEGEVTEAAADKPKKTAAKKPAKKATATAAEATEKKAVADKPKKTAAKKTAAKKTTKKEPAQTEEE